MNQWKVAEGKTTEKLFKSPEGSVGRCTERPLPLRLCARAPARTFRFGFLRSVPPPMADTERVRFAAPIPAACAACARAIVVGEELADVTRVRTRGEGALVFEYAFACRACGASCAYGRSADGFVLRRGLLAPGLPSPGSPRVKNAQAGGDARLLRAGVARRRRQMDRTATTDAPSEKEAAARAELESLKRARDRMYADPAASNAAAAAVLAAPDASFAAKANADAKRVAKRRRKDGGRARSSASARRVRAALGEERAAVVRRAARSLRRGGVPVVALVTERKSEE